MSAATILTAADFFTKGLGPHKYGCLMAPLPTALAKECTDFAIEQVPDCHLGPGGRELTPHITVLYGFTETGPAVLARLRELLRTFGPFRARLATPSLFTAGYGKWTNEDGDVLKMDVVSPRLYELNGVLRTLFPNKNKFPEYKPHVTLAYLDPAISSYYEKIQVPFANRPVQFSMLDYSDADGLHTPMPLGWLGSKRLEYESKQLTPTAAVQALLTKWGCPAAQINTGHCSQFADALMRQLPGASTHGGEAADGRQHVWLVVNGRHYDAESPIGVDSPEALPFFRRHGGVAESVKIKGWVTMGGKPCADGEHCGGTAVELDGSGTIQKGPKGTVGKRPDELPKDKPREAKPTNTKPAADVKPSKIEKKPEPEKPKDDRVAAAKEKLAALKNKKNSYGENKKNALTPIPVEFPKDYDPATTFQPTREEEIDVSKLRATEDYVVRGQMEEMLDSDSDGGPVDVVKEGDNYYLLDGHHRAAKQWLLGSDKIKARVMDSPAKQKEPDQLNVFKSKAKVRMPGGKMDQQYMKEALEKTGIKPEDAASLVGAPDDADVVLRGTMTGRIMVDVKHPDYTQQRYIYRDDKGALVIKNENFFLNDNVETGSGLGVEIFGNQVSAARAAGVSKLITEAAWSDGHDGDRPMNGYYTWPRFGYDAPLKNITNARVRQETQAAFPDAQRISDLMKTKAGRDWWKKNGGGVYPAEFDLDPKSLSSRVFEAYTKERAKKKEAASAG